MSTNLSRRRFLAGSSALLSAGYLDAAWARTARVALPIPSLVDGGSGDPIDLKSRRGAWSFMPGVRTSTVGINQDYLGPTIRTRRNSQLNLRYENTLTEGVSIHGHGLHVPGELDGGPQLEIAPNQTWRPNLSIVQPAATCWYHSHTHGRTGHQVYHGLAGMIIIDDDVADAAELPRRYGVDDLPIIVQDRTFDAQGRLVYSLQDAGEDGWYGETVVINGAISPTATVPAGKVRLRILNAANARFYVVAFADNRQFFKIATDGGYLETPVPLTSMEMSPGERCEIIVDLSDGAPAELLTLFEDQFDDQDISLRSLIERLLQTANPKPRPSLKLVPDRKLSANRAPMPRKLGSHIIRPKGAEIVRTRDFFLEMKEGAGSAHDGRHGGHSSMAMTINGAAMDMKIINEQVERGVWERWRIRTNQGAHPFHVHGCSFLIEQMEGSPASPDQQGWKDTVVADDDDWSEIVVRFDHLASEKHPYMYHCHILEHEDSGMMGQFTVT